MDKKVLEDYIDACAFIKETEVEIKRLEKKKKIVQDKVKGSNPEWPFEPRTFNLCGTTETAESASRLHREKEILAAQKTEAENLKLRVEEWMKDVPFRIQRIIKYRIFKELTWEEVAVLMGRKCTGDSVRLEFKRFMEKK